MSSIDATDWRRLIERAKALRALVVGDAMLDEYVVGSATRLSPEAAVPVVSVDHHRQSPGGAANVARQLAALGVDTTLVAVAGDDAAGDQLSELLAAAGLVGSLAISPGWTTTRKTRVLAGRDHLVRLDHDPTGPLTDEHEQAVVQLIARSGPVDLILVSDYAKGVVTARVLDAVHRLAARTGAAVFVDPKSPDLQSYGPADVIKMNEPEFRAAAQRFLDVDAAEPLIDGPRLIEATECTCMVVTCGERGAAVIGAGLAVEVPTTSRQVYDVGGAGDVFLVYLAIAMVSGSTPESAAQLANSAASLSVQRPGVTIVDGHEVLQTVEPPARRVLQHHELADRATAWRSRGDRIVLTNGCFDLLHPGHIHLLRQAGTFGDRLVVAVNDDQSVQELKGTGRPLVRQADRVAMIAALDGVDAVVLFVGHDLIDLINLSKPDVLVKGDDYSLDEVVGRDEVERHHGRVELVAALPDHSTTELLSRIRAR